MNSTFFYLYFTLIIIFSIEYLDLLEFRVYAGNHEQ